MRKKRGRIEGSRDEKKNRKKDVCHGTILVFGKKKFKCSRLSKNVVSTFLFHFMCSLSLTVCVPSIFSPRTYDSDPTLLNYTTMTWGKDEEKQRVREWNQTERERLREKKLREKGEMEKLEGEQGIQMDSSRAKVKMGIGRKKNITFPFLREEKQNRKNSIQKTELLFLLFFPRCLILLSLSLFFFCFLYFLKFFR